MIRSLLKKAFAVLNRLKLYINDFNKSVNYQHQIIDEQYSPQEKVTYFFIKSVGMSIFPKYSSCELVRDEEVLKNFHPKDVKYIIKTYLLDKEALLIDNIKYYIESKTIKNGKFLFTITLCSNINCVKKMTAAEIINNQQILSHLSKNDVADVCYEAGLEDSFTEIGLIARNHTSDNIIYLDQMGNLIK